MVNLQVDYGSYINEDPMISVLDSKSENIAGFKRCEITGEYCDGVYSTWITNEEYEGMFSTHTMKYENAVVDSSTIYCLKNGVEISVHSNGQDTNQKSKRQPNPVVEYKEDVEYTTSTGTSSSWFKFETTSKICGTFSILIWDEKEHKSRMDKQNIPYQMSSSTQDLTSIVSLDLYKAQLFGKMKYLKSYTATTTGNYQKIVLDLQYDQVYYMQFQTDSKALIFQTITGNIDEVLAAPYVKWERITPDTMFPKTGDSLSYISYSGYIYNKRYYLDRETAAKLRRTISNIIDVLEFPDRTKREEKLLEIFTENVSEEELPFVRQFFLDTLINGTATILAIPFELNIVGFSISMLCSTLAGFILNYNPQSLTSKILEKADINIKTEKAKFGIILDFQYYIYPQNLNVQVDNVLDVITWDYTDLNEYLYFSKYNTGIITRLNLADYVDSNGIFDVKDIEYIPNYN